MHFTSDERGDVLASRLETEAGRAIRSLAWNYPWDPAMADLAAMRRALAEHPALESLALTLDALPQAHAPAVAALPRLRHLDIRVADELTYPSLAAFRQASLLSLSLDAPPEDTLAAITGWSTLERLAVLEMFPSFGEGSGRVVASLPSLGELTISPHHLVATSVRREALLALAPLASTLRVLVLDECHAVDDEVATMLLAFRRLERLSIHRCPVSAPVFSKFRGQIREVMGDG